MTLSERDIIPTSCPKGNYKPDTVYCQSCPAYTTGVFCNISNIFLQSGQAKYVEVKPDKYTLFTLEANSNARVKVTASGGGVSVYFQYNTEFRETAGLVNYVHENDILGHFHFLTSSQY